MPGKRTLAVWVSVVAAMSIALPGGAAAEGQQSFVTAAGTQLRLDGAPYRFTGLNIYNANSSGVACTSAMSTGPALDDALTAIGPGKTAMRAWFFQSMATTNGLRDWSAFDHTLAVAHARGVKVIAVLTNQWGDCELPTGFKNETWYQGGYTAMDPSGTTSYRDWVAEIVDRYKDDPTILAWQLINESTVKPSFFGPCSLNGATLLRSFAIDVGGLVKSLDSNHLVSLGTMGGGQCGAQESEYQTVHDVPEIDLCEYHDYDGPLEPMTGDEWNGLAVRMQQCGALGKPLFVGETGIRPSDVGNTLQARAAAWRAKLNAQFEAGVVGELAWAWSDQGSTLDNFEIGPGDPALASFELPSGRLTVVQDSTPDHSQDFGFAAGGGISPTSFSLDDDSDATLPGTRGFDLVPGSGYSLSQTIPAGWQQTSASCDDGSPVDNIDVDANEHVTCTFSDVAAGAQGYPRPKSASPVRVPLVPAFQACSEADRVHGPPLESASCSSPVQSSAVVTVGTPDANGAPANSLGSVTLKAVVGAPGPPDDSDLYVSASIADVRCRPAASTCGAANTTGGNDYTGRLQVELQVRLTDRLNGTEATEPATVADWPIMFELACTESVSTAQGSQCATATTLNALIPNGVLDGKRATMALDQLRVFDGGTDGSPDTDPNDVFLVQGIFVP